MRAAVRARLVEGGVLDADKGVVVLSGLGNGYEGGSTIFGPHQLMAYIQETLKLADAMVQGTDPAPGAAPEDFSSKLINTGKGLHTDHLPDGAKAFGAVLRDASGTTPYKA